MKAVITAGGRIDGPFARDAGTNVKALAPIRGATMLARIVGALRANGATRIAVVGGSEVRAACSGAVERVIDESPSGATNLLLALKAWPEDGTPLLYATSDLPYVTAEAVRTFLDRIPPGTLAVALSELAAFDRRFPRSSGFGITLAGERVVNGGIFSLPGGAPEKVAQIARRFFDARKQPWRMASFVSPVVLLRFLLGRLSVAHLEAMAARMLQVPARAIRNCPPELAFDVDTDVEYRYACAHE
jgi:GTP:adenosylcobinamide-phosphate guanylyltransferase